MHRQRHTVATTSYRRRRGVMKTTLYEHVVFVRQETNNGIYNLLAKRGHLKSEHADGQGDLGRSLSCII